MGVLSGGEAQPPRTWPLSLKQGSNVPLLDEPPTTGREHLARVGRGAAGLQRLRVMSATTAGSWTGCAHILAFEFNARSTG